MSSVDTRNQYILDALTLGVSSLIIALLYVIEYNNPSFLSSSYFQTQINDFIQFFYIIISVVVGKNVVKSASSSSSDSSSNSSSNASQQKK